MIRRHLLLVGLPGAGKSTAGALAAALLHAGFIDTDDRIAAASGRSVAALFELAGEAAFRRLEREAVAAALAGPPGVIAPGGGWAAQPGNLDAAVGAALVVHLEVSVAEAARRLREDAARPLLAGGDLAAGLAYLEAARRPWSRRAAASRPADGPAGDVAERLAALARSRAGW